jgi:hypothetical protein
MRIAVLILLTGLLFSCSEETSKDLVMNRELAGYIRKRYQAKDVSSSVNTSVNQGKTEQVLEVRVGKSTLIDQSKSEPELFASDIAFRLYCNLEESERKKYRFFSVKIIQNKRVTELRYTYETLEKVRVNLYWLEGYFTLTDDRAYADAKREFDPRLVDTATLHLQELYEPVISNLGVLKNRELQGFTIHDSKMDGQTYRILKTTYILFYEKNYVIADYTLLLDAEQQKLVGISFR